MQLSCALSELNWDYFLLKRLHEEVFSAVVGSGAVADYDRDCTVLRLVGDDVC